MTNHTDKNENSGGSDYLPTIPDRANEYDEWTLWADVPAAAFDDPSSWLHRSQLKQIYGIAERSYFRWINTLKQNGLKRMRPARKDWKVKLFYREDVEKAIAALQAATEARPRRGRKASNTLSSTTLSTSTEGNPPQQSRSPLTAEGLLDGLRDQQQSLKDQQQMIEAGLERLEARLDDHHGQRQSELSAIRERVTTLVKQQEAQEETLNRLHSQTDRFNLQLSGLSSHSGGEFFARALQTVAELAKSYETALQSATNKLNLELEQLRETIKGKRKRKPQRHKDTKKR